MLGVDKVLKGHHGDCIGADKNFHDLLFSFRSYIVLHPPKNTLYRAFCPNWDEIRPTKEYLDRNDDIAKKTDFMIACPKGFEEELRSGTWATIRRARKRHKDVYIIWPDGTVKKEINNKRDKIDYSSVV